MSYNYDTYDLFVCQGDALSKMGALLGIIRYDETDAEFRAKILLSLTGGQITVSDKVCECGADKHGFASHSNWCPKYD